MEKMTNIKTVTYEYEDGFMVDIVIKAEEYEAWLYAEQYGIKIFMFSVLMDDNIVRALDRMKAMIIANIDEHIEYFKEEYMD